MNFYDIIAYVIIGIALLGSLAIIAIRLFWKRTHDWVQPLPSKIGAIIGFSAAHIFLLICVIACVVCAVLFVGNSKEVDTKVQQEIKNETNILNQKAVNAEKKLAAIPEMPSDDLINEMFNSSKIKEALANGTKTVAPPSFNFFDFINSCDPLEKEKRNPSSCENIKGISSATKNHIKDFKEYIRFFVGYEFDFLDDFGANIGIDKQNRKNEFEQEMKKMNVYAEAITTSLTKEWKVSLVQYGNSVDMRTTKMGQKEQSNIFPDIALLYVPSAVIIIFIILSILLNWTNGKSRFNRILLIPYHVFFVIMALLIFCCAAYISYGTTKTKDETPIAEDKSRYFDFQIPSYNNGPTKSSYKIISTSPGHLFDSLDNDILIGEVKFFDNWENDLVIDLDTLKNADENTNKFIEKTKDVLVNWEEIGRFVKNLETIKEDQNCSQSFPAIEGFLVKYAEASKHMGQFVESFTKKKKAWEGMETKLRGIVKDRVRVVKDSMEKRRTHINDGIMLLNIDCKSTMKTFAKINDIQGSKEDENKRGIIVLINCSVLIILFICMIFYLFTYRRFGPSFEESKSETKQKEESVEGTPTPSNESLRRRMKNTAQDEEKNIPAEESTQKSDLEEKGTQTLQTESEKKTDTRREWAEKVLKFDFKKRQIFFVYNFNLSKTNEEAIEPKDFLKKYPGTCAYAFNCNLATRVKLKGRIAGSNFIHANFINIPNTKLKFIAATAPRSKNMADFWHMIWHEEVKTVLMLCRFEEDGKSKCAPYFSETTETYGDFTVKMKKSEKSEIDEAVWRVFEVTEKGKRLTKTINHVQYSGWPDQSIPENPQTALDLLAMVKKLNSGRDTPILVHCSAGVGRTGTLIAIEFCNEWMKYAEKIDPQLEKPLAALRRMRDSAVQQSIQYIFLYAALFKLMENEGLLEKSKVDKFLKDFAEYRRTAQKDQTKEEVEKQLKKMGEHQLER